MREEQEGTLDDEEKFDYNTEDPFVFIHKIIKKNVSNASEIAARLDPVKMLSLNSQLYIFESTLYIIKGMLKQRKPDKFE